MTAHPGSPPAAPGPDTACIPPPEDAARITGFLVGHPWWSAFWDKRYRLWRVSEDDPDSGLYAEAADAATVLGYMQAHS